MYAVRTIGDLTGPLSNQDWGSLGIPPGWVPAGTPGLPGMPAPVPGPPRPEPTSSTIEGPAIVVLTLGGVALGALGLWAWNRYGKGKR